MSENKSASGFNAGQRIGKYTLRQLIGRGRKTEVYRAFHPEFKREVAIKIFFPGIDLTTDIAQRFRQETRAIAAVKHPNVIRIFDYGAEGQVFFLVMELVLGTTLRDMLSARPTGLDREDTLRIFSEITSAVASAHDQNIIHGNIKPDNVLIDPTRRPVVSDFSIPLLRQSDPTNADLIANIAPAYLAPEQITGSEIGVSGDIYALGILLYEMVTGDVPFKGSRESVMSQHLHTAPTPPSQINVGLDPRIEYVILKALNKTPADRYASTRDMLADLEREEEASPYETLNLDRDTAQEVRKRRSEVVRFHRSRVEGEPDNTDGAKIRLLYVLLGTVTIVAIILAIILAALVL